MATVRWARFRGGTGTDGLARRATAPLIVTCVVSTLFAVLIAGLGVLGITNATRTGNAIAGDELATMEATARFGRSMDAVYAAGEILLLTPDAAQRRQVAAALYRRIIPAADADLAVLERLHADDDAAEKASTAAFAQKWVTVRDLLAPGSAGDDFGLDPARAAQMTAAFEPLSNDIDRLRTREDRDGAADQAHASAIGTTARWAIAVAAGLTAVAAWCCALAGGRRVRRTLEPTEDQVEFADTLQLAENEDEAHQLLQRHLQRTIPAAVATVLNRNNSADRLEAMTPLPAGSPLRESLQHAEPRSCLAVRSGRPHHEDTRRTPLLGCPVCVVCPGISTCTPLTVGGEVIGSVLVERSSGYDSAEQQRIRDSVSQAAPVLANLRNLAIAELRAATDSLTGLPNKRAVGDSLKRMLAQASRTLTPLALLQLDLDHFKNINDQYGHPVGDQALAGVGAALQSSLRASDFAGRNGGEEFAVILPDTDIAGALRAAEKIRATIAEISLPGVVATLTASVGVAIYPDHATTAEHLERLADSALYVAKRTGRDRVEAAAAPGTRPSLIADEPGGESTRPDPALAGRPTDSRG